MCKSKKTIEVDGVERKENYELGCAKSKKTIIVDGVERQENYD